MEVFVSQPLLKSTGDVIDTAPAAKLDTPHARAMLGKRYCAPEWALLEEVAPATGGGTTYADAVAVNLWSSRGHAIHGFEIKVSRGDWLRELKQPAKAEGVYGYCDHWWILAPAGIVKDGELPPTWGLLELRTNGIVLKVNAPRLEPKPITRAFFASLTRRATEELDRRAEKLLRDKTIAMEARVHDRIREGIERATRRSEEVIAAVAKVESETGLVLSGWDYGRAIKTIKLAQRLERLQGYGDNPLSMLVELLDGLEKAAGIVRSAMAPLSDAQPSKDPE